MTIMQKRSTTPPRDHDDDNDANATAVTFTLSKITTEPEELDSKDSGRPLSPPSIDVNAHLVPDTIQVALLDRKQEMMELVQHNKPFSQMIQQYLGPADWPAFENILYSTRQQLSDKEWISNIWTVFKAQSSSIEHF